LLLRDRDTFVQLHPRNELYFREHHENENPGSLIPSVRVPVQQESPLRRWKLLPTCLLGKGFLILRYQGGQLSLHLQMQKSVSVCYPGEMKRRKKTISRVQNLLLVEDLEFTTERGL
jgi:hypothetical protein